MSAPAADATPACALISGGLDSAVLLARMLETHGRVHPVYVRFGLRWEAVERPWLERYLSAVASPRLAELVVLEVPAADVYGPHWSIGAGEVPDERTADEAVYLPGRNILLLAKAAVWCSRHGVGTIALGPLAGNPFPDASDAFFDAYQAVLSRGLDWPLTILRPLADMHKPEVVRAGRHLPLERTFSCIDPAGQAHCGQCNKCAERARAFREAGVPDPTRYAAGKVVG